MAAHEYDPDDNFDHAFHAHGGIDDEDALEAVAWQFLLLVNPDDEDAALEQFAAFQRGLDEAGERADPALLLRDATDWKAGFHVAEDAAQGRMEVLDELAARWRLRIEWPLDEDAREAPDTSALLHAAFHLALGRIRVDESAEVVGVDTAQHRHLPGFGVHLDFDEQGGCRRRILRWREAGGADDRPLVLRG